MPTLKLPKCQMHSKNKHLKAFPTMFYVVKVNNLKHEITALSKETSYKK